MKTNGTGTASGGASGYLECEKRQVYWLLMLAGGYFGAFTYSIRGGVFCNAQTGNFVLLAMALGQGSWTQALYYVIPITAYCLGAFVSEAAERRFKGAVRWETVLVSLEMAVTLFLGFLPESAPVQITQVLVNFICSMQYNTFRQAQGIPMATTFCTNHIRQVGVALYGVAASGEGRPAHRKKLLAHAGMLAVFVLGGTVSTVLCGRFLGKAVWFAELPLGLVLADLLRADLGKERERRAQLPHGY